MPGTAILPLPAPPPGGDNGLIPPSQISESQHESSNEESSTKAPPAPVATHAKTIGIIHPPPDIRNIVDKTAQFVAKNGPEFEKRIIASNANNPKFNFLNSPDPYHAYYQHKLTEFRAQNLPSNLDPSETPENVTLDTSLAAPLEEGKEPPPKPDPAAQFRIPLPKKVLEPPEPEHYTVRLPEGITGEELDIIKLTAQFVARNGQNFLTALTSREMNSSTFHFLKPTHSMFTFFTGLADAYSKVLMPPKGLIDKLSKSSADMTTVLERCLNRLEWDRSQDQARQKVEDEIEQERVQMAMIDWHDFVVVETIDFADHEDDSLPTPMLLEEVVRRSKTSAMEEEEAAEPGKEVEMEMDEEEVQLVEEGMRATKLQEVVVEKRHIINIKDDNEPMRIVKNWKRPEERVPDRDPSKFMVSPITGELIPINEMSEHMRISLIDPKYKEQKERMFAKIRETTLAQDDEISRNIVGLARTRPDIFGTTEEEVSNAVKAEIEKKKDEQPNQIIWDGHTGSIGRTATQALSHPEDFTEAFMDNRVLPGPIPPPRPGVPSLRPLPPPPGLALNLPRVPPSAIQYGSLPPRPPTMPVMMPSVRPPPPPMMMNRPPGMHVAPPPGALYNPMAMQRPPFGMPIPPPGMPVMHFPQGIHAPPLPEDAPPPLPEEPEPKRLRIEESLLTPEDQFLAQNPGPATINIYVPNVDEGNLKGQVLEISVESLGETVGSLKEKVAGEIQLPANKQKLSGKIGFLKDNMSLAYYNVGPGDSLSMSLRERGGRKR